MGMLLRTSRRTGVALPFWLAIPALAIWVCLAVLYLAALALIGLGILTVRLVRSWR